MLLVLPVLVLPFITLAFWAGGGGKPGSATKLNTADGLNLHLPDPKVKKESVMDKLGFYEQADRDSQKLKEAMRNDPFFQEKMKVQSSGELEGILQRSESKGYQYNPSPYNGHANHAEDEVMKRLEALKAAMNQPQTNLNEKGSSEDDQSKTDDHVSRLEGLLASMNQSYESDPELDKLSGMMDKIIAIQHPEKVKEEVHQEAGQSLKVFEVKDKPTKDTAPDGFYSLEDSSSKIFSNAIEAVAHEDQFLVSGSVIKFRLLSDAYIKDEKIPAGSFVFGVVSLNGERLKVEINSIRYENSIYPVKLKVYDMDGLEGIYIPGTINRDAVRQSSVNSLQSMQLSSLDPSLSAQVTTAGINSVKSLLSRHAKLVKVKIKSGYKVLLSQN